MSALVDMPSGTRYGTLVTIGTPWVEVVGMRPNGSPHRGSFVRVRCDCGTEKVVRTSDLRSGKATRCGVGIHAKNYRHGQVGSPTYSSWENMIARCTNPKAPKFRLWGGRGITVCDLWLQSFENFLVDMGERPPGTTLDRIDTEGNYEPGNCRWATPLEQAHNQRPRVRKRSPRGTFLPD